MAAVKIRSKNFNIWTQYIVILMIVRLFKSVAQQKRTVSCNNAFKKLNFDAIEDQLHRRYPDNY